MTVEELYNLLAPDEINQILFGGLPNTDITGYGYFNEINLEVGFSIFITKAGYIVIDLRNFGVFKGFADIFSENDINSRVISFKLSMFKSFARERIINSIIE